MFQRAFAVFQLPSRALARLLEFLGGGKNFAASLSNNVVANLVCSAAIWAVVSAGTWIGAQHIASVWEGAWPEPCSGAKLCILIAGLADDDSEGHQSQYVRRALDNAFESSRRTGAVEVIPIPRKLERDYAGDSAASRDALEATARKWLSRMHADLLVYGTVIKGDMSLELHFVAREASFGDGDPYSLANFTLPKNFNADFASALAAVSASKVASAKTNGGGKYLVPVMAPIVSRLRPLIDRAPPGLGGLARAKIFSSYALAERTIGAETEDRAALERAIAAYRAALREYAGHHADFEEGATFNDCGVALFRLGERGIHVDILGQAVDMYRQALRLRTRSRWPPQWADTQLNLGTALWRLSQGRQPAQLIPAIAAIEAASAEYKRERSWPLWAMGQDALGNALGDLSNRESGEQGLQTLHRSIKAFRDSLSKTSAEKSPLYWADRRNNFGTALLTLAQRQYDRSAVDSAVQAFRDVAAVYGRYRMASYVADTDNNIGEALATLAEHNRDPATMKEALAAEERALNLYLRLHARSDAAELRGTICHTEQLLGERANSTVQLHKAVQSCNEAIAALDAREQPAATGEAYRYLGETFMALGDRETGTHSFYQAVEAYKAAENAFAAVGTGPQRDAVRKDVAAANAAIARRRAAMADH